MKLDTYLKEIGETPCGWAKKHRFPLPVITRFLKGERGLSLKTALKIQRATDGKVNPDDLGSTAL
jgi:plasmid maintenance system antidote protein VapI